MPLNRSVPDVREKRRNWKKHMSEKDINHLVFLDESGVNINMTRHYARAWKNRRAVDKTPLNTPCNTTVLSSIRLNGDCAYTVYPGGTTAERFAEYLKTKLCKRRISTPHSMLKSDVESLLINQPTNYNSYILR